MSTKYIAMELGNALESLQREPQPDAFVANVAREAQEEIARLQAQVAELQKLSVRNIMLAIVPGDGSGQEIYAESVEDVVSTLTTTDEKNETLQAQVDALAVALDVAKRTMADYDQCDNDNWPCFQAVCAALAAVGR